jgi:hypothetical protein
MGSKNNTPRTKNFFIRPPFLGSTKIKRPFYKTVFPGAFNL